MGGTNGTNGVDDSGGAGGTERVERALRAMLDAEAERIQEYDLRPATAFPPTVERRWGRTRGVVAVLGAAAATAGLLVGVRVLTAPPPAGPSADGGTEVATRQPEPARLAILPDSRTTRLTKPAATVTVPVLSIQSDNQKVADSVSQVVNEEIQTAVTAFKNRVQDADPGWPQPLRLDVVASAESWQPFVTVRLDETSVVGWDSESRPGLPIVEYAALVFDTRTGERVLPTDLFTDVDRASAVVRSALLDAHRKDRVTADQLAQLSLEPSEAGSTTPLSCYPLEDGLHCLVDDGALTPDYPGRLEATVPWDRLAGLLAPGVRP